MRIIQIRKDGKWIYVKTVADDQSNRIVRALNKEGHTARSYASRAAAPVVKPEKRNTDAQVDKLMSAPYALTKPERKQLKNLIKPVITQSIPDVTLLDLNDIVAGPTVADITKAVRNVAKASRPPATKTETEFTAAQLAAMLRIEGAGRMEDPARCGLKIRAATLRVLVLRGVVLIGLNDSLHLSVPGRRALLAAIAKIVAPNAERK